MLQSLWVLAALAVAANDDNLTNALHAVSKADNYAFSVGEEGGTVEGRFQKGRPVSFTADRINFFKKDDLLVYEQAGTWQRARTGTLSDPLAVLGASAKVSGVRLPHEELAGIEKHLMALKKAEEKGQTVYRGDLSEEGAKALARPADRAVARGGAARLWVDGKGRLVRYEITIRLKGRRGDAEVDGEATKEVTIRDVGATKVDVPDPVKKLLE